MKSRLSGCVLLATVVPIALAALWYKGLFLLWTAKIGILTYLILFGILPLIFCYSTTLQLKILFLNFVQWPINVNFSRPESVGMEGTRNFYLKTDKNVRLGAWQILPKSLMNQSIPDSDESYQSFLRNSTRPVVLYMHGNSGNRASSHRVELYKLFQNLDYHVVCFDYRSYGDSEEVELSETGVVMDSKYVLKWLMNLVNGSAPVYVWGHSLGTGVSTHVLAQLADEKIQPAGLILESPFNNIADEVSEHPFAQIFRHLPWFHWVIVRPFKENEVRFESDQHILKVQCPVMILHAEDDAVVPFKLGLKLYEMALNHHENDSSRVQMVRIDASFDLGHKYICRYEKLPIIIESFVKRTSKS